MRRPACGYENRADAGDVCFADAPEVARIWERQRTFEVDCR